jgi:hypothetical protein
MQAIKTKKPVCHAEAKLAVINETPQKLINSLTYFLFTQTNAVNFQARRQQNNSVK